MCLLPEDPCAEGMEGPGPGQDIGPAHDRLEPLLHLACGLVGEGEAQDLPGRYPLGDEVGHPVHDDPGLAGPGAGKDQDGPVHVPDGPLLFGVEPVEYPVIHVLALVI